eukprot:gene3719-4287_t
MTKVQFICLTLVCIIAATISIVDSYAVDIATRNLYIDAYVKELNELLVLHKETLVSNTLTHKCIHNQLSLPHLETNTDTQSNIEVPHNTHRVKALQSTTHPIKILANTGLLDNGTEPQSCYSVGQVVVIDDDGNHTPQGECSSTTPKPCSYTCTAADVITQSVRDLFNKVLIPDLQGALADKIYVNGPATTILPYINNCGEYVSMPQDFTTTGFSGDIAIWFFAHPTDKPGVEAYGAACVLGDATTKGRPLAGRMNIAPKGLTSLVGGGAPAYDQLLKLMQHEASHILAFSDKLFPDFIDRRTGEKYANGSTILVNVSGTTPSNQTFIVKRNYLQTPTVLSYIKSHFGCDSMLGGELEPDGGNGTAGSHWRPLIVGDELMRTHGASGDAPFTNLTLAVFYDSGWYEVDASKAQPWVWGKGMGCNFFTCNPTNWNRQGYWKADLPEDEDLPEGEMHYSCSATRNGVGLSYYAGAMTSLLPQFQHWDDIFTFGEENKDIDFFHEQSYYCFNSTRASVEFTEVLGPDSACFEVEIARDEASSSGDEASSSGDASTGGVESFCYEKRCTDNVLWIKIGNHWYACPSGVQRVPANSGITIICPSNYNPCILEPLQDVLNPAQCQAPSMASSATCIVNTTTSTNSPTSGQSDSTTSQNIPLSVSNSIYGNINSIIVATTTIIICLVSLAL